MSEKRNVIWSNINIDLDDWKDYLLDEYPELDENDEVSLYHTMLDENDMRLDDERINLNIQLNQPIIVIGDLGLWSGRRMGYKEIDSGNIRDCLYDNNDYVEWYVDRYGDMRADSIHHDGTNHYLYRVWKDDVTDCQKESLKSKLYRGLATRRDISRVTRSIGKEVCRVYGW